MTDQDRTQVRLPNVGGSTPRPGTTSAGKSAKGAAAPGQPVASGQPTRQVPTTQAAGKSTGKGVAPSSAQGAAQPKKNAPGFRDKLAKAVKEATDEDRFAPPGSTSGSKAPRRARLRLTRVDPWSVMKMAFLLSIAFGIVMFVAVAIVWGVLGAAGVWDSINKTVAPLLSGDSASNFDVTQYVGASRVLGFTIIVSVLDVILLTAMATLAAFLYNMAASLLGGVDVTLVEEDR